jgi:hypothetical protein
MALKQVLEIFDALETAEINTDTLKQIFIERGLNASEFETRKVKGPKGETQFVKIRIRGKKRTSQHRPAPTLGIIGNLGGIGARPHRIGLVSDADGAITALAAALKITEMRRRGDILPGTVIVTTHLSPCSPVFPHKPVPFMDSPVSVEVMNRHQVDPAMEAILSVDTTKGNRIINHKGFAISPTVKDGYILRVSEDLLDIIQTVTGRLPAVFPVTTQDITPYGNGLYHLNSIMQPATATHAPVVGAAITTEVAVPGCSTGANHPLDIELATRFCVEVAKAFGQGRCAFYDEDEFKRMNHLYGSLEHLKSSRKKR